MIHLDTNYLIALVQPSSETTRRMMKWLGQKEQLVTSAIAWSEFLTGPLSPEHREIVFDFIRGQVIPFGEVEAEVSAALFNLSGRRRGVRQDCLIAAAAICAGARLATENVSDFRHLARAGLELA